MHPFGLPLPGILSCGQLQEFDSLVEVGRPGRTGSLLGLQPQEGAKLFEPDALQDSSAVVHVLASCMST